jgi:hypothetical protein
MTITTPMPDLNPVSSTESEMKLATKPNRTAAASSRTPPTRMARVALATTRRGMTDEEGRAYHHVFDEPDSDHVVLTWPRTIPMREGDRGWADMQAIERRLPELSGIPTLLLWVPEDDVFPIAYANRLRNYCPMPKVRYFSIGPRIFFKMTVVQTSPARPSSFSTVS